MVLLEQDEILEDVERGEMHHAELVDKNGLHIALRGYNRLINILHVNIRSVHKNLDNLILLLESYNLYFNDVIILSETFRISSVEGCSIPGYDTYYNQANYNKNDGVMILVKSDICCNFSHCRLSRSQATLGRLTCRVGSSKVGITAVYKPPPISKQDFTLDVLEYLESLGGANVEVFAGDMNIDILGPHNNDENDYLSALGGLGFVSYINSVTRFDTGTCLDHIFVREQLNPGSLDFRSFILDYHMTDHAPVMLNIGFRQVTKCNNNERTSLIRYRTDMQKILRMLRSQDWTPVVDNTDPESATKQFVSIYKNIINQSRTEYVVRFREHKKIKKWITNGLITSIKHRDKLKRRLLNNYSVELENEYKVYRNSLNSLIQKQKNSYYREQINLNQGNMKKMYGILRDATCDKLIKNASIKINNKNGDDFLNDVEMADYCNEYFVNIGLEMAKKIPTPQKQCKQEPPTPTSMFLTPVCKNDLIRHISSLKNNSSPGFDGISAKMIKQTHLEILVPLEHIINQIFITGTVPSDFKTSVVTPVHKSGSKTSIENYRPISLINNFAKIFEKCLKEKLISYYNTVNILSANQYGFLEGRGTTDALYRFTTQVTNGLNIGKKCMGVFVDLARAFDTVPHDRLLAVLSHCGVRGSVLRLMKNYLTDRIQTVKINNAISKRQIIRIGVPQGTVLGPLLFITYIDSLLKQDIGGTIVSYADDTTIIFDGVDWEETRKKTIRGLEIVKNWLETYKLTLNLNKTHYIAFSLTIANRPNFSHINIDGSQIHEVSETKYLGIIIDQFLKWHPHIDYLSGNICRLIHRFYILKQFLSTKILIMIYKALVESIIGYGLLVWGGLYNNALHKLEVNQKFMLKIIYGKNRTYPTRLLFTEKTCNIRTLYMTTICMFMHTHSSLRVYVNHSYETRTRDNMEIRIPVSYRNINLKYLSYLAPKVYNLLPRDIRDVSNRGKFRRMCSAYIFQNYDIFSGLFK